MLLETSLQKFIIDYLTKICQCLVYRGLVGKIGFVMDLTFNSVFNGYHYWCNKFPLS